MNSQTRVLLGIGLLIAGLFYNSFNLDAIVVNPKLAEPTESIVLSLSDLEKIEDAEDANKVAGVFHAMSKSVDELSLKTNLQVQYFMSYVGKNTIGDELLGKYPKFAPSAASKVEEVIGPQNSETLLTQGDLNELSSLLYGFAWKLYDKGKEEVFDKYDEMAKSAIAEYNNEVPDDEPEVTDCPCDGKGYIVHGDGHRTDCPCITEGLECQHDPKCGSRQPIPVPDPEPELPKQLTELPELTDTTTSYSVPNIIGYVPIVKVYGMSVRYHLINGAAGQHDGLSASYVDTLTINQQYWLHDSLHGYAGTVSNIGYTITEPQYTTYRTYRRGIFGWRR